MNLRRKQYNTAARETQSARRAEPKDRRALRNEECTNRTATLGLELLLPGDSSTGCTSIVFFRNGDDSPLARDLVQVGKRTKRKNPAQGWRKCISSFPARAGNAVESIDCIVRLT
jgi:hypothetical protein